MASQKIYVSIDPLEYKKNKQDLLYCEKDFLNSLKHLQDLKKIRKEKNNLKLRLVKQIASFLKKIEELETLLPEPKLPKNLEKSKNPEFSEDKKTEKKERKKSRSIEQELREIQQKINSLNTH